MLVAVCCEGELLRDRDPSAPNSDLGHGQGELGEPPLVILGGAGGIRQPVSQSCGAGGSQSVLVMRHSWLGSCTCTTRGDIGGLCTGLYGP